MQDQALAHKFLDVSAKHRCRARQTNKTEILLELASEVGSILPVSSMTLPMVRRNKPLSRTLRSRPGTGRAAFLHSC